MPVPYINRSGVRPPPMLLADGLSYVTNFDADDVERDRGERTRKNGEFIALVSRWRDSAPGDPVAIAVASFFERGLHATLAPPPNTAKPTDVAGILINGEWAHRRPSAIAFWGSVARERKSSANAGICLVCGTARTACSGPSPRWSRPAPIPAGSGRGRDAALVSVNKPAQGRGGKLQLASAPVCDSARQRR